VKTLSIVSRALLLAAVSGAIHAAQASSDFDAFGPQHAVFVMTNNADENEVISYQRTPYGTLQASRRFSTGGRGSGGTVDPLGSQGSLTLSEDGALLFAANAGSGTVSTFRVLGTRLLLTDRVPSGGSEPNAVAQHDKLVYVLNTAGSSSVVGFRVVDGHLVRIADSLRFLSGNFVESASLAFTPDGKYLVVTERASNSIDVFRVLADGRLSSITVNASAGPGAFSVAIAPNGAVLVSETGAGGRQAPRSPRTTSQPTENCCPSVSAFRRWAPPIAGTSSRRTDASSTPRMPAPARSRDSRSARTARCGPSAARWSE
jgi:6-phosphogluconolactonase